MTETIIWIVVLLLAGGSLLALLNWLANSTRQREEMSEEEWENRERGANLLGAGVMAFDQIIRSDMKTAIEYQQDEMRGQTEDRKAQGAKGKSLCDDQELKPKAESDARNDLSTT